MSETNQASDRRTGTTELRMEFGYPVEQFGFRYRDIEQIVAGINAFLYLVMYLETRAPSAEDFADKSAKDFVDALDALVLAEVHEATLRSQVANLVVKRISLNSPLEVVIIINTSGGMALLFANRALDLFTKYQEARVTKAKADVFVEGLKGALEAKRPLQEAMPVLNAQVQAALDATMPLLNRMESLEIESAG